MSNYKTIVDYTTVEARTLVTLERLVKAHMDAGWQPLGGGFLGSAGVISRIGTQEVVSTFCQTMVKRG